MRLTVGPLPPAVYWRRRAVVLGALLLVLTVLYASCSGSSDAGKRNTSATPTPTTAAPTEPQATASGTPTADDEPSETSAPADDEPAEPIEPNPEPAPPVAANGSCANADLTVVPSPAKTAVPRGTPMDLRLKIKNTSDRTCSRDVGADLQELRLVKGAQTVWSSDRCGAARGSDVRSFPPGTARDYTVTWNGKSSTKCAAGVPDGPVPAAGEYQLLGRLGDKYSTPVKVTLR